MKLKILSTIILLPLLFGCDTRDISNDSVKEQESIASSEQDGYSSDIYSQEISSISSEEDITLDLHKIEAVNPTCTRTGNTEYYVDQNTSELYADSEGKVKINSIPTIKALGHVCGNDNHCTRCGLQIRPTRVNATLFSDFEDSIAHNCPLVPDVSTYIDKHSSSEKIIIDSDGNYRFTGSYSGGIEIATNVVQANIILDGATIELSDASALLSKGDANIGIYLVEETNNSIITNKISDTKGKAAAVSIEGDLSIFGAGSLSITGNIKNAISCDGFTIKDSVLNATSVNNCIFATSFDGFNANVTLASSGKKGLNIESVSKVYSLNDGYVYLDTMTMDIDTKGDGINSSTYFYSKNSIIDIQTEGEYVFDTEDNRDEYGLEDDDFTYRYENGKYIKTPTDHLDPDKKYYALAQSCKGIKNSGIKNGKIIVEGNYYTYLEASQINIDSTDDAINSKYGSVYVEDSELILVSNDDGITCDEIVYIDGGTFNISGAEGIEGKAIELLDGSFIISSSDDAINASGEGDEVTPYILIEGGSYNIESQGDVIDANGIIWIIGGNINVYSMLNKEGLFDADDGIFLDGGSIIGCGSYYEYIDISSKQPVIVLRDDLGTSEVFNIYKNDTLIGSTTVPYYSTALIFSNPNMIVGDMVKVVRGDNIIEIEIANLGTNIYRI